MQSLWMVVAAVFFAGYSTFVKLSNEAGIGPWEILFYRSLFGLIVVYFILRGRGIVISSRYFKHHMLRSLAGCCAIVSGIYSVAYLNLGLALSLNYTSSLFLGAFVIGISILHHTKINWGLMGSLLFGFLGVVTLLGPTIGPEEYWAAGIGLLAGFFEALAVGTVKRLGTLGEPEFRTLFYLVLAGTIVGGGMVAVTGSITPLDGHRCLLILGVGLSALFGQYFLTRAFSRGNMVLSGALQYSVIFFGTIFGDFVFGEKPTAIGIIGMIMIVVAGICASWFTRQEEKLLKTNQQTGLKPVKTEAKPQS